MLKVLWGTSFYDIFASREVPNSSVEEKFNVGCASRTRIGARSAPYNYKPERCKTSSM